MSEFGKWSEVGACWARQTLCLQQEWPSMPDDAFFSVRNRAYELADTGRYKRWDQVAFALQAEGFLDNLIARLDADRLAVMMITRCCDQARSNA